MSSLLARPILENESLSFFPSLATRTESGDEWRVQVHGWLYRNAVRWRWRKWFLAWLRRGLRLSPTEERSAILEDRLTPFLVDGAGDRRIDVEFGGSTHSLPRSSETGHVEGTVEIPAAAVADVPANGWAPISAEASQGVFVGRVQLVEPEGLSVISDLDDTVKLSNVRVRRELLANTFLRPFAAVPGMSDWYREWQDRGAVFHYVSNSPWQLTPMLAAFLEEHGFPAGSMHLRPFRIRRGGLRRFLRASRTFKRSVVEELFADLPQRRFVLVGDSSELDPELYGDLLRAHPDRIEQVFVRNVTGEQRDDDRLRAAFDGVPPDRWQLFVEPHALA